MKDYRTISAEDFLTESIEMKIRWLARQLRKIDKAEEIWQWAISVTSVNDLLQKIKAAGAKGPKKCGEIRTIPLSKRRRFSLSAPHVVNIQEEWVQMGVDVGQLREISSRVDIENARRRKVFKGKRSMSRPRDPMGGDRAMDKTMATEKLKAVEGEELRKEDGNVSKCRATPVVTKSVKVDGDRKRIKLELKDMMQSVEVVGDKVIASGTVGAFDRQPTIIEE